MELRERVEKMREHNFSGALSVSRRLQLLKSLKAEIKRREAEIVEALKADFNKNLFDAYATEIGIVYEEINYFFKNLKKLSRPKRAKTSLFNFPSKGRIYPESYGVALIIAPWNYPFQLSLVPLVGAVAAGNCAVVKPASRTPKTAKVISDITEAVFLPEEVFPVLGSRATAGNILDIKFDYIFFTGGAETGKKVMAAAAKHLTPVSLELGGKSPCVVDEGCEIKTAARRIAWGKYLNGGQTCVAPDYICVHEKIAKSFIEEFAAAVREMFYKDGGLTEEFPYLISEEKGEELSALIGGGDIIFGGGRQGRKMEPTAIRTDFDSPIMKEEIFGPVAPVITFGDFGALVEKINGRERPLALYYFGKNEDEILRRCKFGGGAVNDTVTHVSEGALPFGGVGASGMGRYHGKASFDTFTHYKSVLIKGKTDIKVRYCPHTEKDVKFLKKLMK